MLQLMADWSRPLALIAFCGGTTLTVVFADLRPSAVGLSTVLAALVLNGIAGYVKARRVVDQDDEIDLLWADIQALQRIPIPEYDDRADPAGEVKRLVPLFASLDDNPMAQLEAAKARQRDRVRLASGDRQTAWELLVQGLDIDPCPPPPADSDIPLRRAAPRCTCGVMRGVITPSRSCAFHGRHSW